MATYSVKQIAEKMDMAEETVRRWIRSGKLKGSMSSRRKGCYIDENDFVQFCDRYPQYKINSNTEQIEIQEQFPPGQPATKITINYTDNDSRNSEGYSDPTAYLAMRNIDDDYRFKKLLKTIFSILDLSGFELDGRITLIDKKTGRIYK